MMTAPKLAQIRFRGEVDGHVEFLLYSLRILTGYRSVRANLHMPCKLAPLTFYIACYNCQFCAKQLSQIRKGIFRVTFFLRFSRKFAIAW